MCGIGGIFFKDEGQQDIHNILVAMSDTLHHRGPDGEGFLVYSPDVPKVYYRNFPMERNHRSLPWLPQAPLPKNLGGTKLAFLHRRLSIIDLSPGGHQPMTNGDQTHWITYNGEIYNYLELRKELQMLGHSFYTESDTEVLLAAYKQWGKNCVLRFNGMWSFVIFDRHKQELFASRDRLGVKPFYYVNTTGSFAFASEQKALVKAGMASGKAREKEVAAYLLQGALERNSENFFEDIFELQPGHNLFLNLQNGQIKTNCYYQVEQSFNNQNESKTDKELSDLVWQRLDEAVRFRLRSDVEVGTCLSGGIDSSALAVIMARHSLRPLHCFTSVFPSESFNEESHAESVCLKIRGQHHKIEPTASGFFQDLDDLIYSQDVPIWSTSTYAQHQVMRLAANNKIKVVLDGQGADELFAGYHHHFIARWNQLLSEGKRNQVIKELSQWGKSIPNPLLFFLKQKLKGLINPADQASRRFLKKEFLSLTPSVNENLYKSSLNEQLKDDIERTRLKIFLKCEDRAGMWHSVESRTPFSDDLPLIETAFSFDGARKIKQGVSKFFLREAVKPFLPEEIYTRYDKVGFESPMAAWLASRKKDVLAEISEAKFPFLKNDILSTSDLSKPKEAELVFKLFVLARWQKLFQH